MTQGLGLTSPVNRCGERGLSFGDRARDGVADMDDEPIQLPIDGVLDLHPFNPHQIKELVPDYLTACRERGILQVRIIHGKGIGNLRRTVHAILARRPEVVSYSLDYPEFGGWGATIVHLNPPESPSP